MRVSFLNVSVQKKIAACARVAYISMPRNGEVVCLFVCFFACLCAGKVDIIACVCARK